MEGTKSFTDTLDRESDVVRRRIIWVEVSLKKEVDRIIMKILAVVAA